MMRKQHAARAPQIKIQKPDRPPRMKVVRVSAGIPIEPLIGVVVTAAAASTPAAPAAAVVVATSLKRAFRLRLGTLMIVGRSKSPPPSWPRPPRSQRSSRAPPGTPR